MQDTTSHEHGPILPIKGFATPLESRVAQVWPPDQWKDLHVLLAVSGGADSIALLRVIVDLKRQRGGGGRIFVAHLHHGLRPSEADTDQAWVEKLCSDWELPLKTGRVDIPETDAREGWEAAARNARYDFLLHAAEQFGARFVATAHTADDQVETVLHRLLRGTGIDGLQGIPFLRPLSPNVAVVRPMLTVTRADVISYLSDLQQDFRTDATNADPRFTRNWIRKELLPTLRERLNPEVDGALLRLSRQATELQQWISSRADQLCAMSVETKRTAESSGLGQIHIARETLRDQTPLLLREVCKRAWQQAGWPLRDMGHAQWQQLAEMVIAGSGKTVMFPGGVRAELIGSMIVLQRCRPLEKAR